MTDIKTRHKRRLAEVAVQCSADTFVVKIATFAKHQTFIGHFKKTTVRQLIYILTIFLLTSCGDKKTVDNSPVRKAASAAVVDSLVLRNRQLLVAAKRWN